MNTDKQPQTENTEGTIFQFLDGSHSYNGKWFGDYANGVPFWWRRNLREELEALLQKERREAAEKALNWVHDFEIECPRMHKQEYLNKHYPLPQPPKQ